MKRIILIAGVFILAGIIYLICFKISLALYKTQPVGARGWNDVLAGNAAIFSNPVGTIKSVYKTFLQLFIIDGIINFSVLHKTIYMVLILANSYLLLKFIKENKTYGLLMAGGFLLFPMVVMTVRLLTEEIVPWSMYPAMIFVPILGILFGSTVDIKVKYKNCIQYIIVFCMVYIIGEQMYIANVDYINLQKRNLKMQAACTRILDRIETSEEYYQGMPVVFAGALQDTYPNPLTQYEEKLKGYEAYIMDWLPYKRSSHMYAQYITNYLGVYINTPPNSADIINELQDVKAFEDVSAFPATDCTYVYGDVLVVKLSE